MKTFLMPLLLVLLMLVAWLVLRSRARKWRIVGATAVLAGLTGLLVQAGVSPLLTGPAVPQGPEGHWLRCVGILWWVVAARMAAVAMRRLLERDELSREARITADLLSGMVYLATLLIILDFVLLLPVGGLVATSGVVAVVIGLALQNTLADVFSGIAVGIERPFGPGDRVTLTEGIEGTVIEINWRSVRIQTDSDDIATIPNSVIAKAQLLNRSVPTRRRSVHLVVTCPAEAKPELVLELLRRAAMLCPIILSSPEPLPGMVRFGVRTNAYSVDYFVEDTLKISRSRTALLSQIHRQFRCAGVIGSVVSSSAGEVQVHALLAEFDLFSALDAAQLKRISAQMIRRSFRTGDFIAAGTVEPDRLAIITSGVVDVVVEDAAAPSIPAWRVGPGEMLGDVGSVAAALAFRGRAASDGELLEISSEDLWSLVGQDPRFVERLERAAAEREVRYRAHLGEQTQPGGPTPHLLDGLRSRLRGVAGHAAQS